MNWCWHFGLRKRRGTNRERGLRRSRTEPGDAVPSGMNSLQNSFAAASFWIPLAQGRRSELIQAAATVLLVPSPFQLNETFESEHTYTKVRHG